MVGLRLLYSVSRGRRVVEDEQRQSMRCGEEVTFDCCGLLGTFRQRASAQGQDLVAPSSRGRGALANTGRKTRDGRVGLHTQHSALPSSGPRGHARFRLSRRRFSPSTVWLTTLVPEYSTLLAGPLLPDNNADSSLLTAQNDGASLIVLSVLPTYTKTASFLSSRAP